MTGLVELQTDARYDATHLPRGGTGADSSVWLGVALLVTIEAIVVFSLVTAYFYFRVQSAVGWPPPGFPLPDPIPSAAATGLLFASTGSVAWANWAARRERRQGTRAGLGLAALLVLGYVVLSTWGLGQLTFDWTRQAYGSLVWTLLGYQQFHALALFALAAAVFGFAWNGRFLGAKRAPLQAVLLYWAFVAASSVATYATVYLSPYV